MGLWGLCLELLWICQKRDKSKLSRMHLTDLIKFPAQKIAFPCQNWLAFMAGNEAAAAGFLLLLFSALPILKWRSQVRKKEQVDKTGTTWNISFPYHVHCTTKPRSYRHLLCSCRTTKASPINYNVLESLTLSEISDLPSLMLLWRLIQKLLIELAIFGGPSNRCFWSVIWKALAVFQDLVSGSSCLRADRERDRTLRPNSSD